MITQKDVQYIASLSRIHLSEDEALPLASDLEKILEYIAKLKELDVTGVQPTSHVLPLKNVYRDDVVVPSLGQQRALRTAPQQHAGSFKVPKVIE